MNDLGFAACLLVCAYFGWYLLGSVIEAVAVVVWRVRAWVARRSEPIRVVVMDMELGVITVEVDHEPGGDFGDGVAAGVVALMNILSPVDNSAE